MLIYTSAPSSCSSFISPILSPKPLGIPTVSVGFITPPDDTYDILTYTDGDNYKMAVIKDDVLIGFIAQGDISYVGPYTQLVKEKIKVDNLANRVFELGYSDFFKIKEDGQFEW